MERRWANCDFRKSRDLTFTFIFRRLRSSGEPLDVSVCLRTCLGVSPLPWVPFKSIPKGITPVCKCYVNIIITRGKWVLSCWVLQCIHYYYLSLALENDKRWHHCLLPPPSSRVWAVQSLTRVDTCIPHLNQSSATSLSTPSANLNYNWAEISCYSCFGLCVNIVIVGYSA